MMAWNIHYHLWGESKSVQSNNHEQGMGGLTMTITITNEMNLTTWNETILDWIVLKYMLI